MKRYTYYGKNGDAYLKVCESNFQDAINRFAELEDAVEKAEEILREQFVQNGDDKNKLTLQRIKKILESHRGKKK